MSSLFSTDNCGFRPRTQYNFRSWRSSCFLFVVICLRQVSLWSRCMPKYCMSSGWTTYILFSWTDGETGYKTLILKDLSSMSVRASYMKLTRDTHLTQQFIYYYKKLYMFRSSICPSSGVLGCIRIMLLHVVFSTRCCGWGSGEPVCSLVHWCKFVSDCLHTVHKTTHRLLSTSATTHIAEHHMQ